MEDDVKAVAEALRRFHNTSLAFSIEIQARAVVETLKAIGWSPPNPGHDRELLKGAAEALEDLLGWESLFHAPEVLKAYLDVDTAISTPAPEKPHE